MSGQIVCPMCSAPALSIGAYENFFRVLEVDDVDTFVVIDVVDGNPPTQLTVKVKSKTPMVNPRYNLMVEAMSKILVVIPRSKLMVKLKLKML